MQKIALNMHKYVEICRNKQKYVENSSKYVEISGKIAVNIYINK